MSTFDPLLVPDELREAVSPRAWLTAMLETERALANAGAVLGLVPAAAAAEITDACRPERFDMQSLMRDGRAAGNPVEPLVRVLVDSVGPDAAAYVHYGATSQDVMDTAAMLVLRDGLPLLVQQLDRAASACAGFAREHRQTPMVARTLLQQALPTTFGLKSANWLIALLDARRELRRCESESLAAQLGGAVGTLAAFGESGLELLEQYAREVNLPAPLAPWHTNRVRLGQIGAALAAVVGVSDKVALDVILLAQTEVAEVREADGGPSSTLPHKRNPIHATLARAAGRLAAAQAAVLVSPLTHEHERAAGAWQAEWEALSAGVAYAGGALCSLAEALRGLVIDAARMRRNLELTAGAVVAERVVLVLAGRLGRKQARAVVRDALASGQPLREALAGDMRATLTGAELDAVLDPTAYLGSASALVDRALERYGHEMDA